jgi:hypothetical protein
VTTYIPTEIPEKNQEQSVSGENMRQKVKIESALSYKLSLKVKQNSNAAFAVYIKPAWLASILPNNLIFISRIEPASDNSLIRTFQPKVYSLSVCS